MTRHQPLDRIAEVAAIRAHRAERAFGLHPALFVGTIGAYFAFLGIMGATFMNGELVIPFAIFAVYIAMAFAVPAMWARLVEPKGGRFARWDEFMAEGMMTGSGHLKGGAIVAQVMTLPVLIVGWALIIAAIRATV